MDVLGNMYAVRRQTVCLSLGAEQPSQELGKWPFRQRRHVIARYLERTSRSRWTRVNAIAA